MGCIYTGISRYARKHGKFKIGQTGDKYPTKRLNVNELECIYYLSCPNITPTELDLLEKLAAYTCQRLGLELQIDRKDWFYYNIDNRFSCKEAQAEKFAIKIMERLVRECAEMDIRCEIHACYLKGKRYSCAASKIIAI